MFEKLVIGPSTLLVKNLAVMTDFYTRLVGLEILSEITGKTTLGFQHTEILKFEIASEREFPKIHSPGLYHNAIVHEQQTALVQTLKRLFNDPATRYIGSADHLVSEAFYFEDPEHNGLELYFDREPKAWIWDGDQVMMDSKYLDPQKYLLEHSSTPSSLDKKLGHVHLKVADLLEAEKFYVDTLGFSVTGQFPGALFISDGTYHHHLGLNIWESHHQPVEENVLGLQQFELHVSQKDLERIKNQLANSAYLFSTTVNSISVTDPNDIQILLLAE